MPPSVRPRPSPRGAVRPVLSSSGGPRLEPAPREADLTVTEEQRCQGPVPAPPRAAPGRTVTSARGGLQGGAVRTSRAQRLRAAEWAPRDCASPCGLCDRLPGPVLSHPSHLSTEGPHLGLPAKGLGRSGGPSSHWAPRKTWGEVITPKYFLSTPNAFKETRKSQRTIHCGRESSVEEEVGVS